MLMNTLITSLSTTLPLIPSFFSPLSSSSSWCSGKCYKLVVLAPVLEKRSADSSLDSLPHTVTLISMPSATNSKRGFSVSVIGDAASGLASVQVKE